MPPGAQKSLQPQSVAGGSCAHLKTPRVTTKFGQIFRLASDDKIADTASSVPTKFRFPISSIASTSLKNKHSTINEQRVGCHKMTHSFNYSHHRESLISPTSMIPNFEHFLERPVRKEVGPGELVHEVRITFF